MITSQLILIVFITVLIGRPAQELLPIKSTRRMGFFISTMLQLPPAGSSINSTRGIAMAISSNGGVNLPQTISSTSTNTGALTVAGGVGIGGSLNTTNITYGRSNKRCFWKRR